jgi:hypothetical protein
MRKPGGSGNGQDPPACAFAFAFFSLVAVGPVCGMRMGNVELSWLPPYLSGGACLAVLAFSPPPLV